MSGGAGRARAGAAVAAERAAEAAAARRHLDAALGGGGELRDVTPDDDAPPVGADGAALEA